MNYKNSKGTFGKQKASLKGVVFISVV